MVFISSKLFKGCKTEYHSSGFYRIDMIMKLMDIQSYDTIDYVQSYSQTCPPAATECPYKYKPTHIISRLCSIHHPAYLALNTLLMS